MPLSQELLPCSARLQRKNVRCIWPSLLSLSTLVPDSRASRNHPSIYQPRGNAFSKGFHSTKLCHNDQDDSMMTASHLRPSQTGTTDTDRYNVCDIGQILPITLTMLSSNKTVKLRAESSFLPGVLHCSRLLLIFFPLLS